jgi:hypothetical protein
VCVRRYDDRYEEEYSENEMDELLYLKNLARRTPQEEEMISRRREESESDLAYLFIGGRGEGTRIRIPMRQQ